MYIPDPFCSPWPASGPQPRIGADQLWRSGERGRDGRLVSGISLTCLEVTCRCRLRMSFDAVSQQMMTVIVTDREYQMKGLMMHQPLLVSTLLTHAERHHGEQEIVSKRVEGDMHRYRYRDLAQRARRMANALAGLGVLSGDRVATLAWNGYRHMELYYAVSGSGAVVHTLNPRLHLDQIVYMIEHAEDRVLFFDVDLLPVVQAIAPRLTKSMVFVAMTDRTHVPPSELPEPVLCYEDLIDACDDDFEWPVLDENDASSLCYTSGTTGNPKGVLYSHRSTVLHTFAAALPDAMNCSARDSILPVVPMFHVNAWGLPYVACVVGAKLVFPGPALDGKSLYELIEDE